MTTQQAAKMLNLNASSITKAICKGQLKAKKIYPYSFSDKYYFDIEESDLIEWDKHRFNKRRKSYIPDVAFTPEEAEMILNYSYKNNVSPSEAIGKMVSYYYRKEKESDD